jgi:hypothetical protein
VFRLAFGSGMAACIILGFTTIRGGNVASHQAWMARAYALALGAGTQVFTHGIGNPVVGGQRTQHRPEPGRGLGHQPRSRRVRHPPRDAVIAPRSAAGDVRICTTQGGGRPL